MSHTIFATLEINTVFFSPWTKIVKKQTLEKTIMKNATYHIVSAI